jgi:hypothetical protein
MHLATLKSLRSQAPRWGCGDSCTRMPSERTHRCLLGWEHRLFLLSLAPLMVARRSDIASLLLIIGRCIQRPLEWCVQCITNRGVHEDREEQQQPCACTYTVHRKKIPIVAARCSMAPTVYVIAHSEPFRILFTNLAALRLSSREELP